MPINIMTLIIKAYFEKQKKIIISKKDVDHICPIRSPTIATKF